ncbi:MAG: DinB family protein [Acidimicrobiales bacterium]
MSGWVCPECGLDYDTISPRDAVGAVRSYPRRYRSALAAFGPGEEGDELSRRRPTPTTWSALEYTAHAADVLDLTAPSLRRILVEEKPTLFFFDSDTQAAERDYNSQDRSEVLGNLETACADLAAVMEGISADDWGRTGIFTWGERDALITARNAVHEGSHHLRDIEHGLAAVRGSSG